jgi:hypothetical protein
MTSDHFATVELTRSGGGIEIDVKGWPVDRGGRPPRWTQRWKDKVVV